LLGPLFCGQQCAELGKDLCYYSPSCSLYYLYLACSPIQALYLVRKDNSLYLSFVGEFDLIGIALFSLFDRTHKGKADLCIVFVG